MAALVASQYGIIRIDGDQLDVLKLLEALQQLSVTLRAEYPWVVGMRLQLRNFPKLCLP